MNSLSSLEDVFHGRLFKIPDYQRGYAWEKKNWDDLKQDLELLTIGRNHFTGTLVLRPANPGTPKFRDESGSSYNLFDVIDGQQRLTTAIMLLDVIHNEFERLDTQKLADGLKKTYLAMTDMNGQTQTKLTLNRDCQDFFFNTVLGFGAEVTGPQIRSHRLLKEGHEYFSAYLLGQRNTLKDDYKNWLNDLCTKITQHLTVLLYEVENDIDAGILFEAVNDRGRPLTELEKVKNYLLYLASRLTLPDPHDLIEQVNRTWTHIFEELMAANLSDVDNEDQLLRLHWLMTYDYNPKNWENSHSIKNHFNLSDYQGRDAALLGEIKNYLAGLRNAVTAYCDVHSPKRDGAFNNIANPGLREQINAASEKLARLGARAGFLPLLMAVRLQAQDGGECYLQTVEICEKLDFRLYQWMGYRASAAQPIFFRLGYEYCQKPDDKRLLNALARTGLAYCSNAQFAERFERATENWYDWGGLKYFLYEYEQYLARGEHKKPHYLWEELSGANVKRDTIEHILPQALVDSYWKTHFTPTNHQRWVHDIGNLTLTYDNSSLGPKSFILKKGEPRKDACYASSKLFIEHALVHYSDWNEDSIQKRRKMIQEWTINRWQIDEPPVSGESVAPVNESAEERLLRMAEENGVLEEFQALLNAVRHLPVYARMQRNWQIVSLTHPKNKSRSLFWFTPNLDVGFDLKAIEDSLQFPRAQVQTIMGTAKLRLEPSAVDEFIAKLYHLFEEIRKTGKI